MITALVYMAMLGTVVLINTGLVSIPGAIILLLLAIVIVFLGDADVSVK